MDPQHDIKVEVAPIHAHGALQGFIIVGRWPADTVEWTQFLWLAVRMAAVPAMLPLGSTVFRAVDAIPEDSPERSVGVVLAEGQLVGEHALQPGRFADEQPAGLAILHPPSSTISSVPEYETASGCMFLPGLPYLGLTHRAAWIEADAHGTVTRLTTKDDIDPGADPDTAALSLLTRVLTGTPPRRVCTSCRNERGTKCTLDLLGHGPQRRVCRSCRRTSRAAATRLARLARTSG